MTLRFKLTTGINCTIRSQFWPAWQAFRATVKIGRIKVADIVVQSPLGSLELSELSAARFASKVGVESPYIGLDTPQARALWDIYGKLIAQMFAAKFPTIT